MKKPILVSGSHRSGSTWIGKMIGSAPDAGYIHEPFNIGISRYNSPFAHWFEYISDETPVEEQEQAKNYLHSFFGFPNRIALARIFRIRNMYEVYFYFRDVANLRRRIFQRTVIKDPIAIMSVEWLFKTLNCDVIITVRHPAAFIASLKVKGWEFDFTNFLNQPRLMKDFLSDYASDIKRYSEEKPDIIEQGILLWNIIYSVVHYYEKKYPKAWLIVKHEDLSLDPLGEFERIYAYLNLTFSDKAKNEIIASTTAEKKSNHKRDSAENIKTWQQRLTAHEIERIKTRTHKIASHYYSEEDWK